MTPTQMSDIKLIILMAAALLPIGFIGGWFMAAWFVGG